jgi:hypothetical protein
MRVRINATTVLRCRLCCATVAATRKSKIKADRGGSSLPCVNARRTVTESPDARD